MTEAASPNLDRTELSIVMPCLNEAETLETCIDKAQRVLNDLEIEGEIIVADNGSTDGSQEIAKRKGVRLVEVETRGYGSALMGGIAATRGKFVIMGDADDSYDFTALRPFVAKLRDGYDLVMGNRFLGGIQPGAMPALHRYFGNPILTAVGRLFLGTVAGTFIAVYAGFARKPWHAWNYRRPGWSLPPRWWSRRLCSECVSRKFPHRFFPTVAAAAPIYEPGGTGGATCASCSSIVRGGSSCTLAFCSWRLVLASVCGYSRGLRRSAGVSFDVHTLLYATLAVFIGYQSVAFAFFTKIFATNERLLPRDPRFEKLFRIFTLESGLVVGFALMVAGFAGSLWAVSDWGARSFSELEPTETLRIVIPAAVALALGCQIVLFSFFFSVLGLSRRSHPQP